MKQPVEQELRFAYYHLNIGADHIVLFLDDPDDPVSKILADENRVTCVACTEEHWQGLLGRHPLDMPEKQHTNLREGSRLAQTLGMEWAISLDADELLYSKINVTQRLASLPSQTMLFKVRPMEAVHKKGKAATDFFAATFFRVLPNRRNRWLNEWFFRDHRRFTRRGFFGHTQGKTFFRVNAPIDLYRQHRPRNSQYDLPMQTAKDIFVLHYDSMSYDSWQEKWHRRIFGDTRATAISAERALQHEAIRAAMNSGDEKDLRRLFERWHAVSYPKLVLLRLTGLIYHIRIDRQLFDREH